MILGIIGPLDSGQKIKDYINEIDKKVEIRLYIREEASRCVEVIEECEAECDVIMFTGCAVEEAIKKKHQVKKTNSFVSRGGTSILKAFWAVEKSKKNLDRFSIDVVEKKMLEDIINEIEINPKAVFSLPFSNNIDEMEYAQWHIDLFEKGETDIMFTGFGNVYNVLNKKGYPVFRLEATRPLINVCYEQIKSDYALNKAKNSQIAVEILQLIDCNVCKECYYSSRIRKSEVDKIIVEYVRSIQGSIFNFGRDEYVIFAHKGAIDNEDNYNKLFKLQKDIKESGCTIGIGIGIGITAYQAEANGYNALKRSLDSKDFEIYSVDEDEIITGPLGADNELSYSLIALDKYIIEISEKTGLSCESVAKISAMNETRQSSVYDTKELAECLDISDRSARRILNKIVDSGLGRVYAKETSQGGGRPKNLIEITF